MKHQDYIKAFLRQVRARRTRTLGLRAAYFLLAYLAAALLVGSLLFYYYPAAHAHRAVIAGLLTLGFGALAFGLWRGFGGFSESQAALLAERRHPGLKNAVINASELETHLADPAAEARFSFDLIREQLARTRALIEKISTASILPDERTTVGRNLFFAFALMLALALWRLPDLLPRAADHFAHAPKPAPAEVAVSGGGPGETTGEAVQYRIEELGLEFNFPAYSQLARKTVRPSDGKVEALPGTEVKILVRVRPAPEGAELVLSGRDHFSMRRAAGEGFMSSFLVKEKGFYQFLIKDKAGQKHLLKKKYPITPVPDEAPQVVLFLANPKPVYHDNDKVQMFFEGSDDFGITGIDLVAFVAGKETRQRVERMKGNQRQAKGNYTWDLEKTVFEPGDKVEYFLEILDNDNVLGPNRGQSETFSFTIFDSRKEQENLILLQEELTEKLIAQLGTSLVDGATLAQAPVDMMGWKNHLIAASDNLIDIIGLAQRIHEQAENLESFPRPYLNLLRNIIAGLTEIRQEQIETLEKIKNTVLKTTPVGYSDFQMEELNGRLVAHLETDVLFLVRMTNRQKMDQVLDLDNQLSKLTHQLREEFEKLKNKKAPVSTPEIKAKLDQIRRTMQKIMDQLSRQTQAMPDEFLNPDAFKSLNLEEFSAALDNIMQLANQGKMDEALKALEKTMEDLKTLSSQLDQARDQMDNLVDMEMITRLEDSLAKIKDLEKRQKELLEKTTGIGNTLRAAQSKFFEQQIADLFVALKKDVNAIQSILKDNRDYLDSHPVMTRLLELMDQQASLGRQIQKRNQATLDSKKDETRQNSFAELNQLRREMSETVREIDHLRVLAFREYLTALPGIMEKYDTLEELASLGDLNEFNQLFKNTYPEIFQWQNNMRTAHNRRQDIGERMDTDLKEVTRLNSEISKKLGSMMRTLQESDRTLLSEKSKEEMERLAPLEGKMRSESEELARRFGQMNQQNPMVSPELAAKMSRTGRHMKQAESNLEGHSVERSINAENQALKELQEARDLLNEIKDANNEMAQSGRESSTLKFGTGRARDTRRGGSQRMQKEKVDLPSEDVYKVPSEFREEILKAMKKHTPKSYERMVMEYYKELVK
jgi:soluble cytochrome b562